MEAVELIGTAVAMLIGLILTPVVANACETATHPNASLSLWTNSTPVANISGLTEVIQLVPYVYVFVVIGAGLMVMYKFYKA